MGRVVDFAERLRRAEGTASPAPSQNGHEGHLAPVLFLPARVPCRGRQWDVDGTMLLSTRYVPRSVIGAGRVEAWTDPATARWEITIVRDGWTHGTTLQGGFVAPQTVEQAIRTRAQIDLINMVLEVFFGIPA